MFEHRLRFLLWLFVTALAVLVLRQGQLQIVHASRYRNRTEQASVLKPRSLPFVRGGILDRHGEVLVRDEPSWRISADYDAIAASIGNDREALGRLIKRYRRRHRLPRSIDEEEVLSLLSRDLAEMWTQLDTFQVSLVRRRARPPRDRARAIHDRIQRVRRIVANHRGFDAPVAEEREPHALITDLTSKEQIRAREMLSRYPALHVERSSTRRYATGGTAFAHVLGRIGRVTARDVADDPNADDPFARYRADESRGVSGVEWAAEPMLRGRRGQIAVDRGGNAVPERDIAAQNGADVVLTLDAPLQRRLYDLLGRTVERFPASAGGSIVVLDVQTREVLALVSYPAYDPARFDERYDMLRNQTDRLPLRFRAVSSRYAPGSTVKPLACLAGLMNGTIDLNTTIQCSGYLFPEHRDRWRCWQIHGTNRRMAHGPVDVVQALTGSCNVFMYRVGEMVGVDGLCNAFDMVGIGRPTGIGLREENNGINPTPAWLMAHKNMRATPGTARLFAIGQGEISLTPVQSANMMATLASGVFRPITLVINPETGNGPRKSPTAGPSWQLPATPAHWRAIREGMYNVVNSPDGTAYKHAHFINEQYALVGKTGSATAHPWPTSYRIHYLNDKGEPVDTVVQAGAKATAIDRFARDCPQVTFQPADVEIAARWPPFPSEDGPNHAHAWFGGFLQPLGNRGRPDWSRTAPVAFAVLLEFGGSGGRASGPLGRNVARVLLEVLGPTLSTGPSAARAVQNARTYTMNVP